jgi:hypothetical protein
MMPLWLGGGTLWKTMAVTIMGLVSVLYVFFYVVKLSSIPEAKEMGSFTIV